MSARSKHVEDSFKDSKANLAIFVRENPDVYKELLKKLIVQALIKLMEADVTVQVRKSDLAFVKDVIDDATVLY